MIANENISKHSRNVGYTTYKTGVGSTFGYDENRKHVMTYIDNPGSVLATQWQSINYTAFNKVDKLTATTNGAAYFLDIIYGPDLQRWKTVIQKNGSTIKTVFYAGNYEKVTEDGTVTKFLT